MFHAHGNETAAVATDKTAITITDHDHDTIGAFRLSLGLVS